MLTKRFDLMFVRVVWINTLRVFLLQLVIFLLPLNVMSAELETVQQLAIKKLSFLVGNWSGEGKSYDDDGSFSSYHDTEDVWFDVQESLLVIQAKGFRDGKQFYGIHTVIYYDEDAAHYWYNPYTSKGARPFSCHLVDEIFVCLTESKTFRLTFQRSKSGQWNEYGEKLTDGVWAKTFETLLNPVK